MPVRYESAALMSPGNARAFLESYGQFMMVDEAITAARVKDEAESDLCWQLAGAAAMGDMLTEARRATVHLKGRKRVKAMRSLMVHEFQAMEMLPSLSLLVWPLLRWLVFRFLEALISEYLFRYGTR